MLSFGIGATPQPELLRLLLARGEIVTRRSEAVASLGGDRLSVPAPGGGWSPAAVFEHLCLSADGYLEGLRPLVRARSATRAGREATWRPTVMGRVMCYALIQPRRLPAPRIWLPLAPRRDVVQAFVDRQTDLNALMTEAADADWRRLRIASPAAPLIRVNFGDACALMIVHAERHLSQIERALATM